MPRLILLHEPFAGRQFTFGDGVVIGRGTYCDIRIEDSTVSRRHAEIARDGGGWRLTDLGSANGTTCDGLVLTAPVVLDDGTTIVFGEVAARFEAAREESAASAPHAHAGEAIPLELLIRASALSARRDAPERLLEEALDILEEGSRGAQARIALFVSRPGAHTLSLRASRPGGIAVGESLRALGEIALRHVDGFAGDRDALASAGVSSPAACACALPLRIGGETVGALAAEADGAGALGMAHVAILHVVASACASLLDAERSQLPERRVAERDLQLARRVQQHFLPQDALRIDGYRVAERYLPARVVGGDHYDFFRYADGRVGAIIADVSGKAVSAALVMARFGMGVRLLAGHAVHPVELLVSLNTLLLDELEPGMFVTAQALALDADTGAIEIANAGHPAPILRTAQGRVGELVVDPGAPLGADARTNFRAQRLTLDGGSVLLFYTDGLTDAEDIAGQALGLERVLATMAPATDATSLLDALQRTLDTHVGDTLPADDLTLVALSRDPAR
ncbi:MAG: SpoIIE family protein phosphatase [Xanthomonadales bacterium]|nr:SpoIIE family protein phosphatase [Xanthomonadales bacterium]